MACRKQHHASLRDAHGAAKHLAMGTNREGRLCPSIYAYRCRECRAWHLTRREEWDGKPNTLVHTAAPEALQRWAMTGQIPTV